MSTPRAVPTVKIDNDTGGPVWLNLSGPATYNLSLPACNSTITVQRGKYTYIAYGCGVASLSGHKQLGSNKDGRFLVVRFSRNRPTPDKALPGHPGTMAPRTPATPPVASLLPPDRCPWTSDDNHRSVPRTSDRHRRSVLMDG